MKNKKVSKSVLGWVATVLTPFAVLLLAVRVLLTPVFAQIEYRMPGFPEDPFGFTLEDRLTWSKPSISYLTNSAGIDFLEELTFEDGTPIYNADELSHMEDVKGVVKWTLTGLSLLILALVLITYFYVKNGWRLDMLAALRRGAWATIGLIAAILIFVALAFDQLFTWFHMLFFESGTWKFYTSDTLIRLFPMRFWQDAFIAVGVLSLVFSGLIILFSRTKPKVLEE